MSETMRLSARGLRVARTLADLDGAEKSAGCISPKPCPSARWLILRPARALEWIEAK
jgi:hypothetical protein